MTNATLADPNSFLRLNPVYTKIETAAAAAKSLQSCPTLCDLCVWNPRVFADDARGWQCPFVLCLHPQGCLRRGEADNPAAPQTQSLFPSTTQRQDRRG